MQKIAKISMGESLSVRFSQGPPPSRFSYWPHLLRPRLSIQTVSTCRPIVLTTKACKKGKGDRSSVFSVLEKIGLG